MERKIGDKVVIREDLVIGESYGVMVFTENRVVYKSKYAIIKAIDRGCYKLDIDDLYWTDEMFKPTKEEKATSKQELKVYKLTYENSSYIIEDLDAILAELSNIELGDKFTLTCENMDVEDFCNLPEFEGF